MVLPSKMMLMNVLLVSWWVVVVLVDVLLVVWWVVEVVLVVSCK